MSARVVKWIVPCLLLLLAGVWLFWRLENRPAGKSAGANHFSYTAPRPVLPGQLPAGNVPAQARAALATNAIAMRLSNTPKSIGELMNDPHAILLENALIDSSLPLNLSIPKHLQSKGDPGAYIVQARGPVTAAFRAMLARSGAEIVSYIPNNAYLVRVTAAGAGALAGDPLAQSVIPYEPYYKIKSSLLNAAVAQETLPDGAVLTLGLFASSAPQTIAAITNLGGRILTYDRSPFGPVVRVAPPQNWTALAQLPIVGWVEPFYPRAHANDLSRVNTGVSTDTLVSSNYMNLTGSNVIVQVNDSGIDATHPDFSGAPVRVTGFTAADLLDTDGHGTFVAGEIAGNGSQSKSPVKVGAVLAAHNFGSVSNADFRGKAPLATLFAMSYDYSDQILQQEAALTNAPISNNSWNYVGDNSYNLAAASYDAATRDALPQATGSQPVLFVFSAGNIGGGDDSHDPGGGNNNSIESPATGKNVISVGAIQESRSITNSVTNATGTASQPWLPETITSYRIAGFSSRGNVGIGIEGTFGRFKPDVVAPGTFIVSTRSSQWDTSSYFYQNPTNYATQTFTGVTVGSHARSTHGFPIVPNNAVAVSIVTTSNAISPYLYPSPVTQMPIYFAFVGAAFPGSTFTANGQVNVPSDGGWTIAQILSSEVIVGFNYAFSNLSSSPIKFDYTTTIVTTNGQGNQNLVLSNLDNTIAPYYRFESGTSMSAADVSGVLALMEDFFTNTLHQTPSPALLKAMLINGARPTGAYNLQVNNAINYEGWGLVNLPNSLPTNGVNSYNGSAASSIYIQDQSPTNALATGDTHTFAVTVKTNTATMRVTLAWTDPPGNPAAAIKLVNSLELVVTNSDNPTNPVVYYGNDIPAGGTFNNAEAASNSVSLDVINNIQSVILPQPLGTNYTVAVIGRGVNVNAVTVQTNSYNLASPSGVLAPNDVQDYALVISSGTASVPGSFTVADNGVVSNPTTDQNTTFVTTTNQPLLNQFVGANTPLLGTNTVDVGGNTGWSTNGVLTVGMTNQWHFYVVTNPVSNASDFTNAGFITFLPPTLSLPRQGVFAGSQANATVPQADIDLYVTTDSNLMIFSPLTLSNCLQAAQVGVTAPPGPGGVFNGVSLSRSGTEFVVDNGGSKPGEVYYVGVKSENQMASEYDFIPIFSNIPFSQTNNNGDEYVNGQPVPVNIPDGTPANPGVNYVFGLAIFPIEVGDITVTNAITHQNFGDLYGTLTHTGGGTGLDTVDVLNNHDAWGSVINQYFIYNETNVPSGSPPANIYKPSDGPGSLKNFFGQDGTGVWRLTEVDDSQSQTGSVQQFTMFIKRQQNLTGGVTNTIPPHGVFRDFVDVPAGATNLTVNATNVTPIATLDLANPLLMTIKFGSEPTLANADKGPVALVNGTAVGLGGAGLGNSLSVGPSDVPPIQPGRYFVDITNQSATAQTVFVIAVILPAHPTGVTTDFGSTGSTPLLDDAVTYATNHVGTNLPIVSLNVGIVVQHPRISDLVFSLIGPDGTRALLMNNRGDNTANAGAMVLSTNLVDFSANGTTNAVTNSFAVSQPSGTLPVSWNFFTIPDEMTVYAGTNNFTPGNLLFDTGMTGGAGQTNIPFTTASGYLTIIMNQFGNTNGASGDAWTYTAGGVQTNFYYLVFTEDTNLTTTPIKYAVPPFVGTVRTNFFVQTNVVYFTNTIVYTNNLTISNFQSAAAGDYVAPSPVSGWIVSSNQVSVVADPLNAYSGSNFLALAGGVISYTLPTVAGQTSTLTFKYRGPGIAGWWRGENNTNDSVNGNNPTTVSNITFTNGEVGKAFHYDGSTSLMVVPASASLPISNLTVESWVYPADGNPHPIFDLGSPGKDSPVQLWINSLGGGGVNPGALSGVYRNTIGGYGVNTNPVVVLNQWNHLVFTATPLTIKLYCNGVQIASYTGATPVTPESYSNVDIGYRDAASLELLPGYKFFGNLDEASIYKRVLSASEIKAIYNLGTNGKYDPVVFTTSPAQSLAEAKVSVNGQLPVTFNGNNTNWQTQTNIFTATTNGTALTITGLEPGMLLDSFSMTSTSNQVITVTNVMTNAVVIFTNLYYLPEQSLGSFTGKGAFGDWLLEIQDDRAGAGLTNSLVSWELQFVFANTNAVPAVLGGGTGLTNQFLPAGGIAWYQVNVPTNANYATNRLLFASAPVNMWFSTNVPPTTDTLFLPDGTYPSGTNGSVLLSTTNAANLQPVPHIYDGQTYYLGVQNPNAFTVNYGIEVDFDSTSAGFNPPVLPILANITNNEQTLMVVTNTVTNAVVPPQILTYTVGMVVNTNAMIANGWPLTYATTNPMPVISTNGIITWTPSEAQGPGVYTITTVVTDNSAPPLNATNSFQVTVNEVNLPPVFNGTPANQTNNELTLIVVTNAATDPDIPANLLTYSVAISVDTNTMIANGWPTNYATTNPPPVIDTNGVITWTPSEAQGPGVYFITTVVTDTNQFAVNQKSFSVTNSFEITVEEVNTAPFWPTNVPSQTNYTINALNTLVVTNTAMDSDIPPNPLTYQLLGPPGALISTNGIVTWTPTLAQAPGLYTFTTIVTDTNVYALTNQSLSATNVFTVSVSAVSGPFAFTQPAQAVTGTGAQLNGMASPNGVPTTAWFQWGTTTLYGSNTPPVSVGNSFNVVYTPSQISGLVANVPYHFRLVVSNAVAVVYGFDQILDEANVVAWGADYVGQGEVPPGLSNAVAIAGAYDHSLALKNNGTAAAWGDNIFGQATVPAGLNNLLAVAGGEYYSMALKNSGTVVAWGANILGQTNVPAGLNNVVTIAGGTFSSLALKNTGTVVAWGANFFNLTNVPAGLSNAVAVAGGSYHNLAIRNDGTVTAWGDNSDGQLNVPAGLTNVVAIAAGNYHTLALLYNGTIVAWGDNSAGQINVPAGLSNVVAVAAGGFHSLALKSDGSVVAWGDNSEGQTSVPPGLTNFVAISAGYFHSLGLTPQSIASLTNIVLNLTNGIPQTNSISGGGIIYYQINVPANADFATNSLLFTLNGPLNVWFTTNSPPTIATNAALLLAAATSGSSILSTTSVPTNIVPGSTYYLGVQNTNHFTVNYGIEVDFHLLAVTNASTNGIFISSIVYTNIGGSNGFLLTWFAPSNDLFQVQWNDDLTTTNWSTFTNIVSYNVAAFTSPTNTQFNFFDDGSQTPPGLPPMRFYRLILLQASNTLTLPSQSNLVVSAAATVTVTNTAADSGAGAVLTYSLVNAPANASISTNGIIIWTNAIPSGVAQRFSTLVTDNGVPQASATNIFTVFVTPIPSITNVMVTATNVVLQWTAPTNDQFQVQWATNLAPVINWFTFPAILTSTNGLYTFTDTNAPLVMKFYRLLLLP